MVLGRYDDGTSFVERSVLVYCGSMMPCGDQGGVRLACDVQLDELVSECSCVGQ